MRILLGLSMVLVSGSFLTSAWADLPAKTESDVESHDAENGKIKLTPLKASGAAGAVFNLGDQGTKNSQGGTFNGELEYKLNLGHTERITEPSNGATSTYGFLFKPNLRLRVDPGMEDGKTRMLRYEVETNPVSAFHAQFVGRNYNDKIKALDDTIYQLDMQLDSLRRDIPGDPDPRESPEVTKRRNDDLAKIAELEPRLEKTKAELKAEREKAGANLTVEIQAVRPGFIRKFDRTAGIDQTAFEGELGNVSFHKALKVNDTVDMDFCGMLSPVGIVAGDTKITGTTSKDVDDSGAMYHGKGGLCFGFGLPGIGHVNTAGEFDVQYRDGDASILNSQATLGLERIADSPFGVKGVYENTYEHNTWALYKGDRNVNSFQVKVQVTY